MKKYIIILFTCLLAACSRDGVAKVEAAAVESAPAGDPAVDAAAVESAPEGDSAVDAALQSAQKILSEISGRCGSDFYIVVPNPRHSVILLQMHDYDGELIRKVVEIELTPSEKLNLGITRRIAVAYYFKQGTWATKNLSRHEDSTWFDMVVHDKDVDAAIFYFNLKEDGKLDLINMSGSDIVADDPYLNIDFSCEKIKSISDKPMF